MLVCSTSKLIISSGWTNEERHQLEEVILAEKNSITALAPILKNNKQVKGTHKLLLVCKSRRLSKLLRILQCYKSCNLEKRRSLFSDFIQIPSESEKTK